MNQRFCNGMVHVIKEGETLYQLSRMYRVPVSLLLRANPYVDVYNLQVGDTICVPVKGNPQGGMPPYSGTCGKWEVRDAVPMTKDRNEEKVTEENTMEKETKEMQPVNEMAENASEQSDNMVMEGTAMREEENGENVYVTKEGDSLEKILGVDKILLQPGMTIYRQK